MNSDLELKLKLSRLELTEVTVKSEGDFYRDVWFYTVKREQGVPVLTCEATEDGICLDTKGCALNWMEPDKIKKLLPSGIGQKEEPVVEQTPMGQRTKTVILKWSDGTETNPSDAFEILHAYLAGLAKQYAGKNRMTDGPGMMRRPGMPMARLFFAGGILCMGLLTSLFAGCKQKVSPEKISAEEVSEFSTIHLSVSGMSMDSCYGYFIDETDEGWQLRITCAMWGEDEFVRQLSDEELSRAHALVKECGVEKWNGFDESNKNVNDGDSFSFTMELKCGKYLSARGYVCAPENYRTFQKGFDELFSGDKEQYSYDRIPKTLESDDMDFLYMRITGKGGLYGEELKFEFRKKEEANQNTVSVIISSASGELSGGVPEKANYRGKIANLDLSVFQEVVRKYDLPAINGYNVSSSGDGEYFSFYFGYSDEESVRISGNVPPGNYEAFRKELMDLGFWFLEQHKEQLEEYSL